MVSPKDEKMTVSGAVGTLDLVLRMPINSIVNCCGVVCHPHPLHGGTMDNKVVTSLVRSYVDLGIPCVRFNFRGVGGSEGEYDSGIGEIADLLAIVAWLKAKTGCQQVFLAGFSFGSGVVSQACLALPDVVHGLFVAPPVGRYNFATVQQYPCPIGVIAAEADELVDVEEIRRWQQALLPPVKISYMDGASHFFHGQLVALKDQVKLQINEQLALL